MPASPPKFTMPFEPLTIEHLGLRLYSTLPPVINELVSNAYDAESPKVEVIVPTDEITVDSEVIVRDYGHGMDADEVQKEFLPIGRNRRGKDNANPLSKNKKVRVTGRKGLGKLSAFGVADEMQVRAFKSGQSICLLLHFPTIKRWAEEHPGRPYEPLVVEEKTGPADERDGVEIRLRKLKRRSKIDPADIRRGIARRLTVIGDAYEVLVNGVQAPQPGDRRSAAECAKFLSWDAQNVGDGVEIGNGLSLSGWIGFLDASSQTDRGVDIFATGKAVELNSYFNFPSTHAQFARAHLVGEIHADFLDGNEDLAATARNSVVWESPHGLLLQVWGQKALKWAFDQWVETRKKGKEDQITRVGGFDAWLKGRPKTEQRVARRMVKMLVDDDQLEASSATPLLEIIKGSVESVAFRELIDQMEDEGLTVGALLNLFNEWRVIEAREHLLLADGRRAAIEKLEKYIDEGALEVQQLQPLFEEHTWLIDPTFAECEGQSTYTMLLRKHCKEPKALEEKDRRLDILGLTVGDTLSVVELKRPEKTLSREDLEQVEKYVDWADSKLLGTGDHAPKAIRGLLIVGKLSSSKSIQKKVQRLEGDGIRVETFSDLVTRARSFAQIQRTRVKRIAPEFIKQNKKKAG